MAMIICSECGAEISDQAVACPKCGVNQSSIAMIEKIRENRNHPCKNNLPNLIRECDELYKGKWYEFPAGVLVFITTAIGALSMLAAVSKPSFGIWIMVFLLFLPLGYFLHYHEKKKKQLKETLSRTLPCLKSIYSIVDASSITSKFDYVLRNEKFTAEDGDADDKEKMDYMFYSKAYKLGADAIIINGRDTTTKVSGSISTSGGKVKGETSTDIYNNVYVSYVKVKD